MSDIAAIVTPGQATPSFPRGMPRAGNWRGGCIWLSPYRNWLHSVLLYKT